MIDVRPERPDDRAAVAAVVRDAFGAHGPAVVMFVDALRRSPGYVPELALVAVDDSGVVGYVMLSWVPLELQAKYGRGTVDAYDAAGNVLSETTGRPAVGLRFATKLPNATNESGLGLDTTDFYASLLVEELRRTWPDAEFFGCTKKRH